MNAGRKATLHVHFQSVDSSLTAQFYKYLEVQEFTIEENLSKLFEVTVIAVWSYPQFHTLYNVVGQEAYFELSDGNGLRRTWRGICKQLSQIGITKDGHSKYKFSLVPTMWWLTQRRNYRQFTDRSDYSIVKSILDDAKFKFNAVALPAPFMGNKGITPDNYRVQYGETEFDFIRRLLEDAGITFWFEENAGKTTLVLKQFYASSGVPQKTLLFVEENDAKKANSNPGRYAWAAHAVHGVLPAQVTMLYRGLYHPKTSVSGFLREGKSSEKDTSIEAEEVLYAPQVYEAKYKYPKQYEADIPAQDQQNAERRRVFTVTFLTNVFDLVLGEVVRIHDYPDFTIKDTENLLVVALKFHGTIMGEWVYQFTVCDANVPYRPQKSAPRPKTNGLAMATVENPTPDEIYCDNYGRVCVRFDWDQEPTVPNQKLPRLWVSHFSSGDNRGGFARPRNSERVLVDFVDGNPEKPIIVGRVYTEGQSLPYSNDTTMGLRTQTIGGSGDSYSELTFKDARGAELVNLQAQRDLTMLVKNDETVTIRHNLTKTVANDERETTGNSRIITVGLNQSTRVGQNASTTVGDSYDLKVSPADESQEPTTIRLQDKKIILDTGAGASLELEGSEIRLYAATIKLMGTKGAKGTQDQPADLIQLQAKVVDVYGTQGVNVRTVELKEPEKTQGVNVQTANQVTLTGTNGVTAQSAKQVTLTGTNGVTAQSANQVTLTGTNGVTAQSAKQVTLTGIQGVKVHSDNQVDIRGTNGVTVESTNGTVDVHGTQGVYVHTDVLKDEDKTQGVIIHSDKQVDITGTQGVSAESANQVTLTGIQGVKVHSDNQVDITSADANNTQGVITIHSAKDMLVKADQSATFIGMPIMLNEGGLFAARATDEITTGISAITKGSATVLIGGPTFPWPVTLEDDPNNKDMKLLVINNNIKVGGSLQFQSWALGKLGSMSQTKAGKAQINTWINAGEKKIFSESDFNP